MHGRLKIKTTAQQEAERKAEKAEKVKKYKAAMAAILDRRESDKLDQTLLTMVAGVLQLNPDINTLWNIRREVVLKLRDSQPDPGEQDKALNAEIDLTQQCLMTNPKSYGAWHHRCWCLLKQNQPNFEKEVKLCSAYLSQDSRNFHCWDYRRFVAKHAQRSLCGPEQELQFTMDRIESSLSNYSAWHQRSKLLPLTHPDESEGGQGRISDEKTKEEIELVRNATFTDPYDSSAWFYYTWLLNARGVRKSDDPLLALLRLDGSVYVVLNRLLPREELDITVDGKTVAEDALWSPVKQGGVAQTAKIWAVKCTDASDELRGEVSADVRGSSHRLVLPAASSYAQKEEDCNAPSRSRKNREMMAEVLDDLKQLQELEPECRWPCLSKVVAVEEEQGGRGDADPSWRAEAAAELDRLEGMDALKRSLYRDWKTRHCGLGLLGGPLPTGHFADLSGCGMTYVPTPERMCLVTKLDLAGNRISSLEFIPFLLCCQEVVLTDNLVDSLQWLVDRSSAVPAALKRLNLSDNPVCKRENKPLLGRLKQLCSHVSVFT